MTAQEKRQEFQNELQDLLKKHKCSISLEDFGKDYSRNEKIVVDFDYDEEIGIIPQLVIGSYMSGT